MVLHRITNKYEDNVLSKFCHLSHKRVLEADNPVHIHILRIQEKIGQGRKAIQIIV